MDSLTKYQNVAIQKGGILVSTSIPKNKKLQWQCNEGHTFWLTTNKVHRRGKWCMECGSSIGEREIRKVLQEFKIPFNVQYRLKILPNRKYDFCFEYQGIKYLVEFDGEQHFRFVKKYHKTKAKFNEAQTIDRVKTYAAWSSGYRLIRIDYRQLQHIRYHIIAAINSSYIVYFSDPEIYKYITEININIEQICKYS